MTSQTLAPVPASIAKLDPAQVDPFLSTFHLQDECPTKDQIDQIADLHAEAKNLKAAASAAFEEIEERCIVLVRRHGYVAPNAEKSRKLDGKLSTFTVTNSASISIKDDGVETLKGALEANDFGPFFNKLFAERTKWEMVAGAEEALKSESLPKRLTEKVLNLWGRCFSFTPKKPSLKVGKIAPPKPAKKAKKAKVA